MKAPIHKLCGTEHWSTQPCPLVKEKRTKALAEALNQNILVASARAVKSIVPAPMFPPSAIKGPSEELLAKIPAEWPPEAFEKPKRGRPKTTTPEQRKEYLARKARERRAKKAATTDRT